jgi:transposase-like protein
MSTINDYFCPNENCKCYGLRGQGNLVKAGKYKKDGIDRQVFKCKVCLHRFSETRNTIFFRSRYSDKTIHSIIRSVVEGNSIRATARMLGLSKDGVNSVVLTAGAYAEAAMSDLLKNLHLDECRMDELWSFVNKKNVGRRGATKSVRNEVDMDRL